MIYTDGIHLIATDLATLHEFAQGIGLHRRYYHGVRKGHPHYDLTNSTIRRKAILAGAKMLSSKEIVTLIKEYYPLDSK